MRWIAAAAIVMFAAGCGGSEEAPPGGAGARAQTFAFETFAGEEFALGAHKGTPVVLNFWESW